MKGSVSIYAALYGLGLFGIAAADDDDSMVTCGSAVKLSHMQSNYYLHSIEAKINAGSGQRVVTLVQERGQSDSLFIVREANDETQCISGTPVECNSMIRLTHLNSNQNLHSHNVRSTLIGQHDFSAQEVSLYGNNGDGDGGDNWVVVCEGEHWLREKKVKFQHVDTSKYLSARKDVNFNDHNCRGCALMGHLEAASVWPMEEAHIGFKAIEGIHVYN